MSTPWSEGRLLGDSGQLKEENMSSYTINGIRDLDLVHTFECGQCFRWEQQEDGSYRGVARGRIVNIRYDEDPEISGVPSGSLTLDPCTEDEFREIWHPYLDLGRDYGSIKARLSENDDIMRRACEYGYGIRILRQDLWETIVSFIISQNNNIPRIKGCIERLADNFGEPIRSASSTARDIPSPERLAALTAEDLAPVRLGYRAGYLIETARAVCENGLPETPDELSALTGVGPKVASCIALFGMQDYASFPIDVWVMKVMHELYGVKEKDKKAMAEFAREKFGELGGFAQQYLFYYMRSGEQSAKGKEDDAESRGSMI